MGCLKQALLILVGTGKASFQVAEQFTLHQVLWNGAAVDSHKRRIAPSTLLVNGSRRQLFSATGFTTDIDGSLTAGKFVNLFAQLPYCCRLAGNRRARLNGVRCICRSLKWFLMGQA